MEVTESRIAALEAAVARMAGDVGTLVRLALRRQKKHTVRETCERLGVSRTTFYRLVAEGTIVACTERGRTFVTEEECQRYEREHRRIKPPKQKSPRAKAQNPVEGPA